MVHGIRGLGKLRLYGNAEKLLKGLWWLWLRREGLKRRLGRPRVLRVF